jgi:hypothetical protein
MTDLMTDSGEIQLRLADRTTAELPRPPLAADDDRTTRLWPHGGLRTAKGAPAAAGPYGVEASRLVTAADLDAPPVAPARTEVGPRCRRHEVDGEEIAYATAGQAAEIAAAAPRLAVPARPLAGGEELGWLGEPTPGYAGRHQAQPRWFAPLVEAAAFLHGLVWRAER